MKTARRRPQAAPAGVKQAESGFSRWRLALLAAAFFLTLEAYWPSVQGPFLFDDEYLPFMTPGFVEKGVVELTARPLLTAGFWLNAKLFGLEPFSYHLINVLLHFINGVLIFLAVRKLLEMAEEQVARREWLAALAGAVFLLHPVQTESVAYVAGRSESFSLLFFLSAYSLFLYKRHDGIGWNAAAGVLGLFCAAFLTKEHTAVLPALLVWTDVFFRDGRRPLDMVRRNWRLYVPLAVAAAAGLVLVWRVLVMSATAGFAMKELPWHHYFFTQWRALWVYLRLFVLPVGLNADYDFALSRGPLEHGAIFGLIGLLILAGAAWRMRKRFPLALFGMVVFLLLIAPTSSIAPIKDPVAERRLYLPFLGLLLALCDLARAWKTTAMSKAALAAVVLAALSYGTYVRSAVWADPVRLWEDTIAKSPGNSRAHFQLAMSYYHNERCPEALKKFEDAERTGKRDHRLLVDWGLAHDCLNQSDQAMAKFREAAALENTAHVHSLIGMMLAKQNRLEESLAELNEAAKLDPAFDMTYVYRGNVYLLRKEWEQAGGDYRKALSLNPQNEAAQQGLASLAKQRGRAR
ncbi:MAG: hypothetical protein HY235_29185 [Acidobacteria bacterium]|nr:hypothetical protein [Acidobacteriota bacterium]